MGHVRRCLSLAGALRDLGAQSVFLLDGDAEVFELVAAEGFDAIRIPHEHDVEDTVRQCNERRISVIAADSYALSTEYFLGIGKIGTTVAVLDDLADRELPVHLVVNGSAGAEQLRYRGGVQTRFLLGPQYILLRPEFAAAPDRTIRDRVERVLVTVGGSDPHGLTVRLMQWIAKTLGAVKQDVVVGPLFQYTDSIRATTQTSTETITLHESPVAMRVLMLNADLALCGGGQTTYELAATGTPAIAIRTAENQTINLKGLSNAGSLAWAGNANDTDLETRVKQELTAVAGDAARRDAMSRKGRAWVDGLGAARVAKAILRLLGEPTA